MPSRCANTGTRASLCTRSTRFFPPRGTMTSIAPPTPDSLNPIRHRCDPLGVERQAVEERRRCPGRLGFGLILTVGRQDRGGTPADRLGHGRQSLVLLCRRGERQNPRSGAGVATDLAHKRWKIACAFGAGGTAARTFQGLKRRVHGL